jgi:hypothetical protein
MTPAVVHAGTGHADMTPVRTTNPDHVDAHSSAARDCSARLRLKPSSFARGALDGACWPPPTSPIGGTTA